MKKILQSADYFGINFLLEKCIEFYANIKEIDYDLALEIRNVWRSYGHQSLEKELKKANRYLKVSF